MRKWLLATATLVLLAGAATAASSGVTVIYEGVAQFELLPAGGPRILFDVQSPERLTGPATKDDILLTTHEHMDHYSWGFQSQFPGKQLYAQPGRLDAPGCRITALTAGHDPYGPGSNNFMIVEVAGLKIAHLGDLGQKALTNEQLEALRGVDVVFVLLESAMPRYFAMDPLTNLGLVEQIQPKIVIPTHADETVIGEAARRWPAVYTTAERVTFSREKLPAKMTLLVMGENAVKMEGLIKSLNVPQCQW